MSAPTWKDRLRDDLPEQIAGEVDHFEAQIELKKQGKLDDKLFAEARLRRGTYGQRYDNGLRDDGTGQKKLDYARPLTKGPDTLFDAPGMQRIKIPYGRITTAQLETIADLAEEYSDSILHVTTRQDIQLHFVHIEDTPSIMRRLGAVGITTREACGNSVRNVTACEFSGVCNDESFDVTPYADAAMHFFLGHPDVQDFGRKFKIAFSGCHDNPCGLVTFHDLGAIAKVRTIDGVKKRGFHVVVGGGLGAVPVEAKVLEEFCPEEEILPLTQAVGRVFARLGEKQSRARARIKFLVDKLGIEEFKRLVIEERAVLREDPRWTDFLTNLHGTDEKPIKAGAPLPTEGVPAGFAAFAKTNLIPQKQDGYFVAVVKMPLGDFTSLQARALVDLSIKYTGNPMRLTVEQNLVFRWVSGADAVDLYRDLQAIDLAEAGASTISDLVSCPGSDTCKLGISASRGLTSELRRRLTVVQDQLDPAVQKLHVKTSGCFNSCGQHHVADIGFLGVSRQVGGRKVPHFNLILGGQWTENAKSYGLVVGAVPSKNVPEALLGITQYYLDNREGEESFQDFIARLGKRGFREVLKPYQAVPSYDVDPSYYRDWGDPREYGIGDIGVGECAGEIVPFAEFGLQQAEQQLFDAQDLLHEKHPAEASQKALRAMLTAAQALVRHTGAQIRDDAEDIVQGFRTHLHETQIFHDPFVKDKFAQFFFRIASEPRLATADETLAHRTLDEAALFIDASHACYQRMTEAASAASAAE
jgi:sulfite reductase (ferredoxin)